MSEITKALIQFHKDVDKIEKNARANYGKFADLANVLSTVTPALLKNNLVVTQEFLGESLFTTLRHDSGETISSSCDLILSDGRNKTQEWGKAVTYQRRYAIVSLLGLVADMDVDGEMLDDIKPAVKPGANPAPKAATPAPKPTPTPTPAIDAPLPKEEYDMVMAVLGEIFEQDSNKLKQIHEGFKKQFPESSKLMLSQAITSQAHITVINALINEFS
jgi:hypothetical protein